MNHIDVELDGLKVKLMEMWDLVEYQLQSGREAMLNADQELARKVVKLGKKVNNFDVKIDRMCENLLALYTPVAVDLRLVLAGRMDDHSALPDPVFSPRAAVVWKPAEEHAFRVSYNRAFSTPNSLNRWPRRTLITRCSSATR